MLNNDPIGAWQCKFSYVCGNTYVHRILSVGSEANIKGLNITGTSAAGAAVIAKANKVIST